MIQEASIGQSLSRKTGSGHKPATSQRASRSAAGQEAKGAFFFEVEGSAGSGGDPAEPAAQIGDGGPDRWLGEHPQGERQRRGTDVVPALKLQRGSHRLQIRLAELPVRRTAR